MFPHHGPGFNHHYLHHMRRRGPSRILWFMMGGLSVAWWMKAKDAKNSAYVNWNEEEWERRRLGWAERRKDWEAKKASAEASGMSVAESTVDTAINALNDIKTKLAKRREIQDKDEPRIV
ncbi:hypothetical protein FRC03_003533 [Tulasnella sp. 419]|nr:hypothetical protein FRC02_004786 [Tulasnella sp. 418]KAG8942198.1 hypothetical protein FRC03_003533 [Tulasnella sp. 419]